jgi:hypothetical protein
MEILFEDPKLKDAIQLDRPLPVLPAPVRLRARHMLQLLQAIPDIRTLRNWRSACFRPRPGRSGIGQIALLDRHHFVVSVDESLNPPTITIIDVDQEPRQAAMGARS